MTIERSTQPDVPDYPGAMIGPSWPYRFHAASALTVVLVALLGLLSSGCGKSKSGNQAEKTGPKAQTRVSPPSAEASPPPLQAARARPGASAAGAFDAERSHWGPALTSVGATDVLIRAEGPAHGATALDRAIAPWARALRKLPDVRHVWSHAAAGHVRLVVRLGAKRKASEARAVVTQTIAKLKPPELAEPQVVAIVPGQRAVAAMTVIAPDGTKQATELLTAQVLPALGKVDGVARSWVASAARKYQVVRWMPPHLKRHQVALGAAQRALKSALKKGTGSLANRLEVGRVTSQDGKQVALRALSEVEWGEGEPGAAAYTGKRRVVSAIVEAGVAVDSALLSRSIQDQVVKPQLRSLGKGVEHFHHALLVMRRFRLVRKAGFEPMAAFRTRLAALGAAKAFHDVFLLKGLDGVPASLQGGLDDAARWTLWVAASAGVRDEEIYQILGETLNPGGWRVVPLQSSQDTAIAWLTGNDTTAAVFFASNDPVRLRKSTQTLIAELANERRIGRRRSGPRRGPTPLGYGVTRGKIARTVGVHSSDLASAIALRSRLQFSGLMGTQSVWEGLPTGVMSSRQAELPLGGHKGLTPWQVVLQIRDKTEDTPRLRLDGMACLWYGTDPAEDSASEFAIAFWTAIEERLEPSRRLEVRSLSLEQSPLSQATRVP
ncbi:MAG: efflux RND transporter permease subunit [Myxococcales bacterium]|nr:efflux RND transporter permease subunit [Myxococcales bacterium]